MLLQNGFGIQFPYPEKVHGGKTPQTERISLWLIAYQVSANQIHGVIILLAAELKTTTVLIFQYCKKHEFMIQQQGPIYIPNKFTFAQQKWLYVLEKGNSLSKPTFLGSIWNFQSIESSEYLLLVLSNQILVPLEIKKARNQYLAALNDCLTLVLQIPCEVRCLGTRSTHSKTTETDGSSEHKGTLPITQMG